jgi:hypothetical protein
VARLVPEPRPEGRIGPARHDPLGQLDRVGPELPLDVSVAGRRQVRLRRLDEVSAKHQDSRFERTVALVEQLEVQGVRGWPVDADDGELAPLLDFAGAGTGIYRSLRRPLPRCPTAPFSPTHPMQPTQFSQSTQPMHAMQPRQPAQATHSTPPATATLSSVPALPATNTLATVTALPATATLPTVPALPATATLPSVPALPATATLLAVPVLPATATLLAVPVLPATAMLSTVEVLPATASEPRSTGRCSDFFGTGGG